MESLDIVTKSDIETKKVGEVLAEEIISGRFFDAQNEFNPRQAVVIGLQGDLGSGKTTFIQGFAKGLSVKDKVTSPTFVIMKKYKGCVLSPFFLAQPGIGDNCNFYWLYHIDCYRIQNEKDLDALGVAEILRLPQNIVLIEWAERVKKILPDHMLWIKFKHQREDKRAITLWRS